jgi:hypothetical protein
MPKTLVLLLSDHPALATRARRIADGARQVRFAEVDVRHHGDPATGASRLLAAADYDAIVLGVPDTAGAAAALGAFDPARTLVDKVGAAFAPDAAACWAALQALAAHGLLLVPPLAAGTADHGTKDHGTKDHGALDDGDAATDRQLGRRVATAAGWVRHARGHEHAHGQPSSHAHAHPHAQPHPHPHPHDHGSGDTP